MDNAQNTFVATVIAIIVALGVAGVVSVAVARTCVSVNAA